MCSTYGEKLKLTIFGQSHGNAIGMTLSGIPENLKVDLKRLQSFLDRRAPGNNAFSTARREPDIPQFTSGIAECSTNGEPITAVIYNQDVRSADYSDLKNRPRPGHADYTAHVKFGGAGDMTGGGQFSGRMTAPLCIAGGLCRQWLEDKGIFIGAHITAIGGICDEPVFLDWVAPDLSAINADFPVLNPDAGKRMQDAIMDARNDGDSLGGLIECIVTGLPAGIGDALFGGMESKLAQIIYAIPAVKGLDFGSGFAGSYLRGSENNDAFTVVDGTVRTVTNNAGGILGGITTGMPLVFQVAVKPTPSIAREQDTVDLSTMENVKLQISGRHDPCIVPRAVPVVEAAAAIAVFDALCMEGIYGTV